MARNYVVIDTETAPTVKHKDDNAHPETSLVYDFGYVICDGDTGTHLLTRSFVIAETFNNEQYMNSAYYADKLPQYHEGIGFDDNAQWRMVSFIEAWQQFKRDCMEYNVRDIWAWNIRFDEIALNNTIKTYSNGYVKWFKPYKMRYRDAWDYVVSKCATTKKFVKWCIAHNRVSAKGNPSTGAETVYQYLMQEDDFIESHTALDDAIIEAAMLHIAKSKHCKARMSKGQGWRDVAKLAKQLNR